MAGMPPERRSEILGVILLALTAALFLALVTDGYQGAIERPLDGVESAPNALGKPGAWVAGCLTFLLGHAAHTIYCITAIWGCMLVLHLRLDRLITRLAGLALMCGAIGGLLHIDLAAYPRLETLPGGAAGAFAGNLLYPAFGLVGSNIIASAIAIVGLLLSTEFLFVRLLAALQRALVLTLTGIHEILQSLRAHLRQRRARSSAQPKAPLPEITRRAAPIPSRTSAFDPDPGYRQTQPGEPAIHPTPGEIAPPPITPDQRREDIEEVVEDMNAGEKAAVAVEAKTATFPEARVQPRIEALPRAVGDNGARWAAEAGAGPQTVRARTKEGASLRRKLLEHEELPPDYEYPKRYTKPSLDLLEPAIPLDRPDLTNALRETAALLEAKLQTFAIEARVTGITRGPTITRYELEPAPGIKVSRFLALADDLALALKAHRVRIEAPIPGRGRVGIEVPNDEREPVVLRELLESKPFRTMKGELKLALGKDIAGETVAVDLTKMPHLLVAGATGAGKTVCVKTLLASLLFTKTPDELQLMMVDPKMVELSIFNDIPHLITPVVTEPKKAASALNWLIVEMEERYRLFADLRVRNIEVYNESVENGEIEVEAHGGGGDSMHLIRKLPYIVCVIDELADLMMLARAEVEDAIARLAQLARAVGIHVIIATQRPSVDVLTGVIKANFPARISFQVSSRVDSRCILDEIGAERLIGRGDMLYLPAGQSKPTRIQGAFVSDEEMNALIAYLKTQAPPQYRDEIERFGGKADSGPDALEDDYDDLFDEAVRVVLETQQASISMVQRRLRVGYTRAARLIDMMERRGIVGPHTGSKAREILVDAPPGDDVQ